LSFLKVTLSSNYFDIKMNVNLKRGLESMIRNTKQTTATIYKALITGMLPKRNWSKQTNGYLERVKV